ncbi:MAG: MBL fold metallo-hydrolase [Anaerolineae bacterium]|nr:MBL fold metallo-hydrolase [Anaerolineae bacterium]
MTLEITPITTPFMFNVSVNCYLVRTDGGYVLVDTGRAVERAVISERLAAAGCVPGTLKLILLTHGDFDHCGNAAYLRRTFNAPTALHADDVGMVERGDMTWNRHIGGLMKALIGLIIRLKPADRFTPDFTLREGDDLTARGFPARVIELPGHSKGSVGFLAADGTLFCGDLLANVDKPGLWSIIDDKAAAQASLEKLKRTPGIGTVYPGHGQPFALRDL